MPRTNFTNMKNILLLPLFLFCFLTINSQSLRSKQNNANNTFKIIGVGGVDSGKSAYEKFNLGASYIQLYTGMVYKGPGVVREMKKELIVILKKENLKNINEAVGINA